jgi:hypothetical protein
MHDVIEWIKQSDIDFGDVAAWAAFALSLLTLVSTWVWQRKNAKIAERSAKATEIAAEAAVRSANAAEKTAALAQLPEVQAAELSAAPKRRLTVQQDVRWKIEPVQGARYLLRNEGTQTATGVTADDVPFQGLARQLPRDAAVRAGESLEFLLIQVAQVDTPHELWLTWDGQDEPMAVPIPVAVSW